MRVLHGMKYDGTHGPVPIEYGMVRDKMGNLVEVQSKFKNSS